MSETPAVLHGLRCGNPHHPNSGQVYGISPDFGHLVSLAEDGCSELVVSRDGGVTWAAVPVPTLAEARSKLEGGAWQREAERLREHSVVLNTVAFKLAQALGDIPEGHDRGEGDPVELADRLIAERDRLMSAADSADGMPEPCQPIGCDNGHHLAGCVYAAADAGEAQRS